MWGLQDLVSIFLQAWNIITDYFRKEKSTSLVIQILIMLLLINILYSLIIFITLLENCSQKQKGKQLD